MEDKKLKHKYNAKAKDSFKTKLNLFLFSEVINNNSIGNSDFSKFKIDDILIKQYTTEFWQQPLKYELNGKEIDRIHEILTTWKNENTAQIKALENEYVKDFKQVYPISDFAKLFEIKNCFYCGIAEDDIEKLGDIKKLNKKSLRGWSLEIERLNSNLEYTSQNCTLACYWCNNAKTDEFTPEEFKPIGKEIRKIWEDRISKS